MPQGFLASHNFVKKGEDEEIRFEGQLYVPRSEDLSNEFLKEAHHSKYGIHLEVTKTCQHIKRMYWWPCTNVPEFIVVG